MLKVGKHDLTVQTREPLSNGDGLNVLIKREVVGFRASVVEPLKQFEEDGQPFWQYRVEPNEMPAAMRQVRPEPSAQPQPDHNWQERTAQDLRRAPHRCAVAGKIARR